MQEGEQRAARLRRGCCAVLLGALGGIAGAAGDSRGSDVDWTLVCAPQRPVATPGESLGIRAWLTDATGNAVDRPMRFAWTSSTGEITGANAARWTLDPRFGAMRADLATARLTVVEQGVVRGRCEVTVVVAPRSTTGTDRGTRLTGRTLLVTGRPVPAGYGLYSNLVFATPPRNEVERERYLKAIEAYLQVLYPIEELELHRRRSELNVTLLPVKRDIELLDLSTPESAALMAEQILASYDYVRAAVVLALVGHYPAQGGPYIVSLQQTAAGEPKVYLFMDMSRVDPPLIWDWIHEYCALAAQEPTWNGAAIRKLALQVRNVVAVAARNTSGVAEALGSWIQVHESR